MLEYLYRNEDVDGAELVLSQIGTDSTLDLALLCDENNQ